MKLDRIESLYYTTQCRHFNGIQHDVCLVGVTYMDVRDVSGPGMAKFPCIKIDAATVCEKLSRWTKEESAAMVAADNAAVREFVSNLKQGLCPACKAKVEKRVQVGSCVYAKPCGHRLGQGKA